MFQNQDTLWEKLSTNWLQELLSALVFQIGQWKVGTSWISRKVGILEKGVWPPLPTMFLLREHAFMWNGVNLFLWGILMLSDFLNVIIFGWKTLSGLLLFSGVALLNWFTKSSRFEEGFNDNEALWSFYRSIQWVLLLSVLLLLLHKELKGKILLQHSMQYQDLLLFWRFL